jgi:hypothetical protein
MGFAGLPVRLIVVALLSLDVVKGATVNSAFHQVFSLDFGWRFHYGDVPGDNRTGSCTFLHGQDIGQDFIAELTTSTFGDCCAACSELDTCIAWDWDTSGTNKCYLKDNANGTKGNPARVTGTLPPAQPSNASKPGFNDSTWTVVNVPHDYSINGTFAPTNDANHAYLPKVRAHVWVDYGLLA